MLSPRVLHYVEEIARCGSIRRAGQTLNIAPSAINRQLIALEEQLGIKLFERLPRRMRLTAAGEVLIAHAREAVGAERRVLDEIEALKGGAVSHCSIGTVAGVAGDLLAHSLAEHRRTEPGICFSVRVTTAENVAAAVAAGEIDIGFAFDLPRFARTTVAASVRMPCGVVVSPDHPLAVRSHVHLHEISRFPLLLPRPGVTVRNSIDNAAWRAGLTLRPAVESDDFDFLRRCTALDDGVAVLNFVDVLHSSRDGRCVFLPLVDLRGFTQELAVMHCAQTRPSRSTRLVIERLATLLSSLPAESRRAAE
ncbi:MAG: LysR family transcriptional regulator [Rhodosalinus sp.]|uniref:LysR family transcriptional regulator n=1 Tax=Rhodosalinus sp. TaxID=2047741 RepID=UPI00397B0526